jgi:GNAT superfamily N-acetyltransferase
MRRGGPTGAHLARLAADRKGRLAETAENYQLGGMPPMSAELESYLKGWERHLTLPDGTAVHVRPIRPEDEALYGPFFKTETADDLRLRFFGPVKAVDHAFFSRFTHIDYAKAMALIAIDEASGEMMGVVRLHMNDARDSGEYAVIVRSDHKSHGLGWQLMQLIIEFARAKGLRSIEGQVLYENKTMLNMCRELGFEITSDPQDPAVSNVRLRFR